MLTEWSYRLSHLSFASGSPAMFTCSACKMGFGHRQLLPLDNRASSGNQPSWATVLRVRGKPPVTNLVIVGR